MLLFFAILAASGIVSVLFAASLYYGISGMLELLELFSFVLTLLLCYIVHVLSGGRAEARRRRREENLARFKHLKVFTLEDGTTMDPKDVTYDENGFPILGR